MSIRQSGSGTRYPQGSAHFDGYPNPVAGFFYAITGDRDRCCGAGSRSLVMGGGDGDQ